MMRQYIRVLRDNPGFTRLWMAQIISLLGDWFSTIVLLTLVVRYSPGNEGLAVSGLLMARFIPSMLLSPVAGVLVDRFNRQKLLAWSNQLRALVVLCFIPTLHNPDLLWVVYALSVIQFSLSSVFEPGQSSLINRLTQYKDLVIANTIVSMTWSVMLAFGAVVGGLVSNFMGSEVALIVDAVAFTIASALIRSIKHYQFIPSSAQNAEQSTTSPAKTAGFRDVLAYLRRRPDLASVLMVKMGNSIGNVDALMTIYATQVYVLGVDGQLSLGILQSSVGIGALLGPLVLNFLNTGEVMRLRKLIIIGFILSCVGWVLLGGAASLVVVCIGLMIRAMGGSANWAYSSVIIQKTTDDRYLGRIFSLDMVGFYFMTVVSVVIHGALIDTLGADKLNLLAMGTLCVALIPLGAWTLLNRWMERTNRLYEPVAAPSGD